VSEQSLSEGDTDTAESCGGADIAPIPTRLSASAPRRSVRRSSSQSVAIRAKDSAAPAVRPGEPDHIVVKSALALRPIGKLDRIGVAGRSHAFLTPAKLEAFVAVAEEGRVSAAARRLHVSQPALSQTITALERQLGVQLLVRSTVGVQTTEAGIVLLAEARAILARHDQMVRTVTAVATDTTRVIQLGIPVEMASDLIRAVARFAAEHPDTRVIPRHLPMATQLASLRHGDLDISLMREHPAGTDFDTMLVAQEHLGILLARDLAARLACPSGIHLNALAGLEWVSFPRSGSPAWYDELAATLRSHGIDAGDHEGDENFPIPSVTLTTLSAGQAFAFASPEWANPVPDTVVWRPLAGHPVVRRTWAVWPAECRNRDVAHLIAAFEWSPTSPA
jgi:DNA-binding transcriptional LysR family regulator